MTTKKAHKLFKKLKSIFMLMGNSKIWKRIFIDKIDYEKVEEMKRELQMKYPPYRF